MSAPVDIVFVVDRKAGSVAHLVERDGLDIARCGADARHGVRFEFEPGSDWGSHRGDCAQCVAMLRKAGK